MSAIATASTTMPCLAVPTLVHVGGGCDCFRDRANPPVFPRPRSSQENLPAAEPVVDPLEQRLAARRQLIAAHRRRHLAAVS